MIVMTPLLAVIALINGMIGGVMLVLPVLVLNSGTALSLFVILITGFLSFYSCYLYLKHLGNNTDIDKAIYFHFWQSKAIKVIYDFVVFMNLLLILISYFLLITYQWNNMLPQSILNPLLNAVGLLILIFLLKYIRFGAHLLGYGVISIALYCVFLIWMLSTAPAGSNYIPPVGNNLAGLAAAMGQAFSIQQFFVPILKELPIKFSHNYISYTRYVYLIGVVTYTYIAYSGAFGIVNRQLINSPAETIQDFFNTHQWELIALQSIYLLHLYSAYGQFILIAKKRFFSILKTLFGIKNSRRKQFFTIPQVIFIFVVVGVGLIFYFTNVTFQNVIIINGAVLGFFFIYLFPALLHFKCLYFTRPKQIFVFHGQTKNPNFQSSQPTKDLQLSQKYDLSNQGSHDRRGQHQQKIEQKQQNMSKNQQNLSKKEQILSKKEQNVSQKSKPISDKISIFQQKFKFQQSGIAAADQSLIMSQIGNHDTSTRITKLNQQCPCQKIYGWWKFFDFISILCMVLLGLYVMIYSIAALAQNRL